MHTIMSFIKGTFQFLIVIWAIEIIGRIFLKRTFIGRIILMIIKDTWLSLKLIIRGVRHVGRLAYTDTKKINNFIYKYYKKFEDKELKKKVVNENNDNIINFKQTKKKRKK